MASETPFHSVAWFIDRDTVYGRLTCTAPEGAPCRLICDDGCEEWPCPHELVDHGLCNAVEWVGSVGATEESYGGGDERPLRDGPVTFRWDGDGYLWEYV